MPALRAAVKWLAYIASCCFTAEDQKDIYDQNDGADEEDYGSEDPNTYSEWSFGTNTHSPSDYAFGGSSDFESNDGEASSTSVSDLELPPSGSSSDVALPPYGLQRTLPCSMPSALGYGGCRGDAPPAAPERLIEPAERPAERSSGARSRMRRVRSVLRKANRRHRSVLDFNGISPPLIVQPVRNPFESDAMLANALKLVNTFERTSAKHKRGLIIVRLTRIQKILVNTRRRKEQQKDEATSTSFLGLELPPSAASADVDLPPYGLQRTLPCSMQSAFGYGGCRGDAAPAAPERLIELADRPPERSSGARSRMRRVRSVLRRANRRQRSVLDFNGETMPLIVQPVHKTLECSVILAKALKLADTFEKTSSKHKRGFIIVRLNRFQKIIEDIQRREKKRQLETTTTIPNLTRNVRNFSLTL